MGEDTSKSPTPGGQSSVSEIQEQIELEIPAANRTDAPISERPTGNVIGISGDLIDKIMT